MNKDSKQNSALTIIPMAPQAIKYHNEMYPKMIESLNLLSITPISVFVCGPSSKIDPITEKITNKKIDIINELRQRGVAALVGEEEVAKLKAIDNDNGRAIKPDNVYEKVIAEQCDLNVVIRSSPGSVAETHEFISQPHIAYKTAICVDKADSEGYSSTGSVTLHRKQHYPVFDYTFPDDIDSCHLKGVILDWVEHHQMAKGLNAKGLS
jgi:hypothetical protein